MARIRTIKPEFPQSESMGNVSRDARLLFILLWTMADDEGRLRGNSRMLASLLFPYDNDAPGLMDSWLDELEREGCATRYKFEGATYLQIHNWLIHQKIDKPSKSKIPPFDDASRILANIREHSLLDQGSRIKDQGRDQGIESSPAPAVGDNLPLLDDAGAAPPLAPAALEKPPEPDNVALVFQHWQAAMSSPRSMLDDKRRKLIRVALKTGYKPEQLQAAIDGCAKSAWHMGQNDRMTKYNGLDLILRNAEQIDKFIALSDPAGAPKPVSKFDPSRYGKAGARPI